MGESTKAVCAVVLIFGTIAAVMAWMADQPGTLVWTIRIGVPAAMICALGLILMLHSRADLAEDYLRQWAGDYFNRDGFCFAFAATASDGIAYLDAYFQNQYDRPCVGRIALRPARGFFMTRAEIDAITFEIECAPAAFGVAPVAIPVPATLQGKKQAFEVGASVRYPEGKGQRVRFHDGQWLRANANFGDSFRTAILVAGAATGHLVWSSPAKAQIGVPAAVAEKIGGEFAPQIRTLRRLGVPPLGMGPPPR